MVVVDAFPFFNELDLLEIRLNELDTIVDLFVITECVVTHSGKEKPLHFAENSSRFTKFKHKIVHQIVDSVPLGLSGFERDWFQRDAAKPLLNDILGKGDFLIYGDVDEIPNSRALAQAREQLSHQKPIAYMAQDLYYYYVDLREISGMLLSNVGEFPGIRDRKWLGTTISLWSFAQSKKLSQMRGPGIEVNSFRVQDGGWHFSYVGGSSGTDALFRVKEKLEASAHQELNTRFNRWRLKKRLASGKDIFHRRNARFASADNLECLPEFLRENVGRFGHLFTPESGLSI